VERGLSCFNKANFGALTLQPEFACPLTVNH
jgi:hypothetical protein